MLEVLTIKNYALIDHAEINFTQGFNVLSGETGAGKSILIDALSLILGRKSRPDEIREGADTAEITGILNIKQTGELQHWFTTQDIPLDDTEIIIRRNIKHNGRGSASVQSVPVTLAVLKELGDYLIDIHGQHEHQSLFRIETHRKLLDSYAGLESVVEKFRNLFTEFTELQKKISEIDTREEHDARESEFLGFSINEIDAANLKPEEEKSLEERHNLLSRAEEFAGTLDQILSNTSEDAAISQLRSSSQHLRQATEIDKTLVDLSQRFDNAFFELEELMRELRTRREQVELDSSELVQIDERLALITALEKKYQVQNVAGLIEYAEKARTKLSGFKKSTQIRESLINRKEEIQQELKIKAQKISQDRNNAAKELCQTIEQHLSLLGLSGSRFIVNLKGRRSNTGKPVIGPYGLDEIEFLFSANQGEKAKSLKHVASGGELSRIMLALKTVLVESDTVQTLIFDEVDAGIGGKVAQAVGEHLAGLSNKRQVFCITHLASIAVFADNHLQVGKIVQNQRTVTKIQPVVGESRVGEIARMLDGEGDNTLSRDHAAHLLKERIKEE